MEGIVRTKQKVHLTPVRGRAVPITRQGRPQIDHVAGTEDDKEGQEGKGTLHRGSQSRGQPRVQPVPGPALLRPTRG